MRDAKKELDYLFQPRSIAVIGASRQPGKVGYDVLFNLQTAGYTDKLYPINPRADEILGVKVYPDVVSVGAEIDLAIFVIPANAIPDSLRQCGQLGVKAAIIISAGFKETGEDGRKRENELREIVNEYGINLIGPNCLGVIDTGTNLNASFAAQMPPPGDIGFFSQSGALGTAVLDKAIEDNVGISKFISIGNKVDLDEADLLEYLGEDDNTKVILGYIEDVKDGRRFMDVARSVAKKKPVIMFKSGATQAGARAASSHTGSLAGSDQAFQAAFDQSGIIRADKLEKLFDYALAFSYQPLPRGNKLAILTNAGGPGIITTDAVVKSGVSTIAELEPDTIEKLKPKLPATAACNNPVDVIGDAQEDRYEHALNILLADHNVDGVVVLLTPQAMTHIPETVEVIAQQVKYKPVMTSFMGGVAVRPGIELLREKKIPNYMFPERAVDAFNAMARYRSWVEASPGKLMGFEVDNDRAREIIDTALNNGTLELPEHLAREIIGCYGFRLPQNMLARTTDEAVQYAEKIGYPVVMKIASGDILHKSDIGGVVVGIADSAEVAATFDLIMDCAKKACPSAVIDGIMVQEMIGEGTDVIIGMTRDPQFGPMIMFGLGGVYVEILKDVSFRIAPLTDLEARSMISDIRSYKLLEGARGAAPCDIAGLEESLLRLSQLVTDFPNIAELDINPLRVFSDGEGVVALDARICL